MNYILKIDKFIATLIYFYSILIVLRIFLSWLPSIDWEKQPFRFVSMVTDVYLDLFRRFIPTLGGLDFSPIVALLVLGLIQDLFIRAVTAFQ